MGTRETKSARFDQRQLDAVHELIEKGKAEGESEAIRMLIDAGIAEYGIKAGEYQESETTLKRVTNRLAWGFALVSIMWIATTMLLPVTVRLPAFAAAFASLACVGIERVLERHEPSVSQRLALLWGDEA